MMHSTMVLFPSFMLNNTFALAVALALAAGHC
jgi:hypothetical protein